MERYDRYKDSGIEWIGEIPEQWRIERLKNCLLERKENNQPIKTSFVLSLTNDRGVIPYSEKGNIGNKGKEDISGYKLAYPGDIVVNSMNVVIGSVGLSAYFGAVSPVYYMLYPRNAENYVNYFNYIFQMSEFQNELRGLGNGILEIRMRIPMSKLDNVYLPLPSPCEQIIISNFLDKKISEINSLIWKTEKSIELLQEYRKSLISEAVTKGLDPNVPMKDSGVEWIGEIPEGWEIIRLGLVAYIRARIGWRALKAEEYVEAGYPMYSAFNIVDEKFVSTPVNYITEARYLESPEIMIKQGDLMLVKDGAGVGKCALVRKLDHKATVNGSIALISPNQKLDSRFLYYFFESNAFQHFAKMLMGGMGVPHLFQSDIKLMKIVLPLKSFQRDIADYLDQKTSEIDSLIEKKKQLIEKLQEYRKSFISECVTGKVKVPGVE